MNLEVLINPRRACARVTVLSFVCVSVCPSVFALASAYTSNQLYTQVSLRPFLDYDSWIFGKKLPFGGKSHYANELELSASRSRALSGPTKGSSHVKDNWSVGCCFSNYLLVQPV